MFIKKIILSLALILVSTVFITQTTSAATHTVKAEESLADIAARYKTTVKTLLQLNKLQAEEDAVVGAVLTLPEQPKKQEEEKKVEKIENYEVVKTLNVEASAFTANCKGCVGKTAYGIDLKKNPDIKLIAVDPKLIPLGTKVWVEGYGIAIAGDTGGSIKGGKIDVFMKSKKTAYNWGRKNVEIKILKKPKS